jgi:hypothetical protein
MTFNKRIITAIATGAVLLNAMAPLALAADDVTVTGNGAFSNSTVNLSTNNTTNVSQTNLANVTNNITSNATTGGNSSSFNTGGNTKILTGNATTNVDVTNKLNLNKADLSGCGTCGTDPVNVTISGNGAGSPNANVSTNIPLGDPSSNTVNVTRNSNVNLTQDNVAQVSNAIKADSKTGGNDSSLNTGGSSVIWSGDASSNVNVDNEANANIAKIGGGGQTDPSDSSVVITGNGAFSNNKANLNASSAITLVQDNIAQIANEVDADAKTGKNDASFNTGGLTGIVTGNATTNVDVANLANFNSADVSCDCVLNDLNTKIGGNGAESQNEVSSRTNDRLANLQDNGTLLGNDVQGQGKTGLNDLGFSTADPGNDPILSTGDSVSNTNVTNAGNANILDKGVDFHMGSWDIHAQFDFSSLLSHLMLG